MPGSGDFRRTVTLDSAGPQSRSSTVTLSTSIVFSRIWPYLVLARPVNVLIGGLSIFVGALVTGTIQPLGKVLVACLSGSFVAGGANSINDYFDVEIDRRNKPHRPLPSELISRKSAYVLSILLMAIGTVLGGVVNVEAFSIALVSSLLLYVYSAKLKRTVLAGNLTVSLVAGLAFIYGGVAVGRFSAALIPAGFAFLFHLGREIIKDVEDKEGDRQEGAVTFPIRCGTRAALLLTSFVFVVLLLATLLPYVLRVYNVVYLVVVVLGVDTVLVYVIADMWRRPVPKNLHRLSDLLKADMVVGLVAIFLGR